MRFFVSVVEQQGFSSAARQLAADTRTVRLDIGRLESALGVTLLERHPRGTCPTCEGRALYERFRIALDSPRDLALTVADPRDAIAVGVGNSVLAFKGIDLARRAARQLPDVRIDFVEYRNDQLMDALARGEIDTALVYDAEARPGLALVPLFEEQLVFISATRSAAGRSTVEFRDAIAATLALPEHGDHARTQLQHAARYLGVVPNLVFETSSNVEIKRLVAGFFADSVMPFGCASQEISAKKLHARAIVNPPLKCTLHLARTNDRAWSVHHVAMFDFLGDAMQRVVRKLGALAAPLTALEAPLSRALKSAGRRGVRHRHRFDDANAAKSPRGHDGPITGTTAPA